MSLGGRGNGGNLMVEFTAMVDAWRWGSLGFPAEAALEAESDIAVSRTKESQYLHALDIDGDKN